MKKVEKLQTSNGSRTASFHYFLMNRGANERWDSPLSIPIKDFWKFWGAGYYACLDSPRKCTWRMLVGNDQKEVGQFSNFTFWKMRKKPEKSRPQALKSDKNSLS